MRPMWMCVAVLGSVVAQNPPLTPTASITLDGNPTQGRFAFSRIDIPVGVRVNFSGNYPIQILCDGDARIAGQLDVDANGWVSGPGAVTTGQGHSGVSSPAVLPCPPISQPGDAAHRSLYGSAMPFDLSGGSPGGSSDYYFPSLYSYACPWLSFILGGGGGGTLTLEVQGRLEVHGRVSARGGRGNNLSQGSGGSILLRSMAGLTVHASGVVSAVATALGDHGFIRLDSNSEAPVVRGSIDPSPDVFTLPHLDEPRPPVVGATWEVRVAAPRGDGVFLAVSFAPGSWTSGYGTVHLDIQTANTLGILWLPSTGVDPLASLQVPIPNNPAFVGLDLYTAGLNYYSAQPPRYTNTIHSVVR
jgi:hypothetical protein